MSPALPLSHIRIVDLTQAWAGNYATQLLGDLGADVIKIESRRRPDPWRGGFSGERGLMAYPRSGPGERPYNRMYLANSVNRNKRGITLDLSTVEGRDLFLRLVRDADVVTENFTPRVLPNFGLEYERLEQERPGIILLSMPAYGLDGPYRDYPGIGGTMEPMSGNSALLGEPGGEPQTSGVMYPDAVAGLYGAIGVLAALARRSATGSGGHIELAQQETMLSMTAPFYVTPPATLPVGNREPGALVHAIVPAADGWLAVVLADAAAGAAFTACTGEPASEVALAAWAAARSAADAERILLAAGIPAARVRTIDDVVDCPHLNARGAFLDVDQPDVGPQRMAGFVPRFSRTPLRLRYPATGHGAFSRDILRDYLGLDDDTYADLERRGITGEGPPPGYEPR